MSPGVEAIISSFSFRACAKERHKRTCQHTENGFVKNRTHESHCLAVVELRAPQRLRNEFAGRFLELKTSLCKTNFKRGLSKKHSPHTLSPATMPGWALTATFRASGDFDSTKLSITKASIPEQ
jgi:hypothetical protein